MSVVINQEAPMGERLVSHVPRLIEERGWTKKEFTAYCMLAGLSDFTAKRLADGETDFNTSTLLVAARVLEKDISQLLRSNGDHQG
jgi:hypothetical protein